MCVACGAVRAMHGSVHSHASLSHVAHEGGRAGCRRRGGGGRAARGAQPEPLCQRGGGRAEQNVTPRNTLPVRGDRRRADGEGRERRGPQAPSPEQHAIAPSGSERWICMTVMSAASR